MQKKHTPILTALLLVSSFEASALQINGTPPVTTPIAEDDHHGVVVGQFISATGNVGTNDRNGSIFILNGSGNGQYGVISSFVSSGEYTYTLFENTENSNLPASGIGVDRFQYTYLSDTGLSDTAWLIIDINANPDTFHPESGGDFPYDNVDIEFNDRSAQATPLNSARNIKGHLHDSGDKDWYTLSSAGNEIISLEVCPRGTSCFGQKSWVLYVFDSSRLTPQIETERVTLARWLDETGSHQDLTGDTLISDTSSNHMYLAYRAGVFDDALIGVIDPCFGNLNSVNIGVGDGARDYFIAISSPLKGDEGDEESCGVGSVFLQQPGFSVAGHEFSAPSEEGNVFLEPKTYETTEEFISVFPNSDDQYSIKVTNTGRHPLLSEDAAANSATYSSRSGSLNIPSVRVGDFIYTAILDEQAPLGSGAHDLIIGTKFTLSEIDPLNFDEDVIDAYRATYNPENQEVMIPRVTDTESGVAYSAILLFYAANDDNAAWLEVISTTEIQ